jgi:hypothetical protein
MNYTVLWLRAAEHTLAEIWTNAADRNAVTAAADATDAWLRRDPFSFGESRSGGIRLGFLPPLAFLFRIDEPNRTVYVMKVARFRRN